MAEEDNGGSLYSVVRVIQKVEWSTYRDGGSESMVWFAGIGVFREYKGGGKSANGN
jgi:hypothetical protein